MSVHPRRCPHCLNNLPLARRKCPYCKKEIRVSQQEVSPEASSLQTYLAGRFDIISEINRTGKSTLFIARDLILERDVVIKNLCEVKGLSDKAMTTWIKNCRRAVRTDHQNIVKNFTFHVTDSLFFFIAEYVPFEPLSRILESKQPLPLWKSLRIARDIALGAHAAHTHGISHHRIKPSNILVNEFGFAKILDLGSATGTLDALCQSPWSKHLEPAYYFSPEEIETGMSDAYSDQYQIGSILFHMLAGKPLYENPGESGALQRLSGKPTSIRELKPEIPETLDFIVNRALSRIPESRHSSCRELALKLEGLDPELWLPDLAYSPKDRTLIERMLADVRKAEAERNYQKALFIAEQALVVAPYDPTVTDMMVRTQKLLDRTFEVGVLINKAISAFYEHRLENALTLLTKAKQFDKDNSEIMSLTHEVLQAQERERLIEVLFQATELDLAKNALPQAMSKVVKIQTIDPGNVRAHGTKLLIEKKLKTKETNKCLFLEARHAYHENQKGKAEAILKQILEEDPGYPEAQNLLSIIQREKTSEEVRRLKALVRENLLNNDHEKALENLRKIGELDSTLSGIIEKKIVEITSAMAEAETPCTDTEPSMPETPEWVPQPSQIPEPVPAIPAIEVTPVQYQPLPVPEKKPVPPIKDFDDLPFSLEPSKKTITISPLLLISIAGIVLILFLYAIFKTRQPDPVPEEDLAVIATIEPTHTPALLPIETPADTPTAVSTTLPSHTPLPTSRPSFTPAPTRPPQTSPSGTQRINALLAEAKSLEDELDYETAQKMYERILKIDRTNLEAQVGHARCENRKAKPAPTVYTTSSPDPSVDIPATQPIPTTTVSADSAQSSDTISSDSSLPALDIIKIEFKPDPPIRNKELKVTLSLDPGVVRNLTGVWFNYRFEDASLGYAQAFCDRSRNSFKAVIPGYDMSGQDIYYYITGTDKAGNELNYGSAESPLTQRLSSGK